MRRERPRSVSVTKAYGCFDGSLRSGTVEVGMLSKTSVLPLVYCYVGFTYQPESKKEMESSTF
jgi:hypothetical protein